MTMLSPTSSALPKLPDIDEVAPVGPQDEACIREVRQVLSKHGALQRFGLTLLHQHFDVADDEVLVESIDVENRVLTSRPAKQDSVGSAIETSWRLDHPVKLRECETQCKTDHDSRGEEYHRKAHYTTG